MGMFERFRPGYQARVAEQKEEAAANERALKSAPPLMEEFKSSSRPERSTERDHTTPMTPDEQILSSRERRRSKELKGSASTVMFVELKDDGSAIFKPAEDSFSPENGTGHKRERAAYLVDRFFGLNLVPPTVIRTIGRELGSAQRFVADAQIGMDIDRVEEARGTVYAEEEMITMRIFDYIINNTDRHRGNWLAKEGKLYAIDHGLSFSPQSSYKARAHLELFVDRDVPVEIQTRIKEFLASENLRSIFTDLMSELLSQDEVNALFERLEKFSEVFSEEKTLTKDSIERLRPVPADPPPMRHISLPTLEDDSWFAPPDDTSTVVDTSPPAQPNPAP